MQTFFCNWLLSPQELARTLGEKSALQSKELKSHSTCLASSLPAYCRAFPGCACSGALGLQTCCFSAVPSPLPTVTSGALSILTPRKLSWTQSSPGSVLLTLGPDRALCVLQDVQEHPSLTSTHWIPGSPPPRLWQPKCFQMLLLYIISWGQNCPQMKINALTPLSLPPPKAFLMLLFLPGLILLTQLWQYLVNVCCYQSLSH